MAAAVNYGALATELKTLVKDLGIKKEELQTLYDRRSKATEVNKAVATIVALVKRLATIATETPLTDAERKRKLAELEANIQLLSIILSSSPDFDERIQAERELSRLSARQGALLTKNVLRFEDLVDNDGNDLRTLLVEATKDIESRKNLERVLKGAEVALRVGVFTTAAAAKLAIAAAA